MKTKIKLLMRSMIIILMILFLSPIQGFSQIGQNIGFNNGNYDFWKGYQAKATSTTTTRTYSAWVVNNNPALIMHSGQNCFIVNTPTTATMDFTIPTLRRVPTHWGYTHSTQINTNKSGANANKLSYDLNVTTQNCLVTFNYAMVLQSPGHQGYQNPFFRIEVRLINFDGTEGDLVDPCAQFEQVGNNNPVPAGWTTFSGGIWKDWTQVSMNLLDYESQTVRIIFILSGCSPTAHWSYGYVTAKVGPAELSVNACGDGDTVAVIEAPPGFEKYEWISRTSDITAYPSEFATGPIISQSQATATIPADNKLVIRQGDAYANHQYFVVKLTSPSSMPGVPGCEAYIKARVQSMKPTPDFDTILNCDLEVEFVDQTVFGSGYNSVSDTVIYTWDFGDGTTAVYNSFDPLTQVNRQPKHQYTTSGQKTVKLTVSDQNCVSVKQKNIIVPATPDFNIKDSMICIGAEMTIPILDKSMPAAIYEWREGPLDTDPVVHVGDTYTRTFTADQTFWVTASEANTACTRTKQVTISVQGFPEIEIKGDTLICQGNSTTLTAVDNSGLTQAMQWTLNKPSDPPVMTNPSVSPTYTFTPNANTVVYLIARTSQGCMSWKSVNITVVDPIVYADKYKVCPGDEVTLTGERALEYSWTADPEDPTLTTETSPDPVKVNPEETTVYTMRGYGQTGCYSERTVKITVVPKPIAEITYSPEFIDTDNPVLSLKDDSQNGASSKWDISDGTTSTARSLTHRFRDVSGENISVFLTSYNEVGAHCYDTASITLPIMLFSVWVPNAFTPDGDGQNDYFFFYSLNELTEVKFEIFNRWGAKVYAFDQTKFQSYEGMDRKLGWNGTYEGKDAPVGAYTWRLTYKRPGNNRVYDKSGTINIIR